MHVEESSAARRIGLVVGYLLSYALFTTILFVLFILLRKHAWPYQNVAALTAAIALAGMVLRRLLR